jgi:hypothetical protein
MNLVRFSAGVAQRGLSRAVARRVARRRFTVCSVALAAVLASVALTTGPASAETAPGTCLDANAGQVYDGGAIIQWGCNSDDPYQGWEAVWTANTPYGAVYQLQDLGALDDNNAADCLDADAGQVYDGGAVTQWGCDASDPYQLWIFHFIGNSDFTLQNYGALIYQGAADCLDADAQQVYDGGAIIQWGCNTSDPYQQWQRMLGINEFAPIENIGTAVASGGGV